MCYVENGGDKKSAEALSEIQLVIEPFGRVPLYMEEVIAKTDSVAVNRRSPLVEIMPFVNLIILILINIWIFIIIYFVPNF